jgi:hypothetical protein
MWWREVGDPLESVDDERAVVSGVEFERFIFFRIISVSCFFICSLSEMITCSKKCNDRLIDFPSLIIDLLFSD